MKRKILLLILCVFLFIGCANDAIDTKDQDPSGEDSITEEPSKDSDSKNEDPSTEDKNTEERFLSFGNFYSIYDDWVFYESYAKGQEGRLWKCRLDLTENKDVDNSRKWDINTSINADGDTMAFTGMYPARKSFIYNVKDGTSEDLEFPLNGFTFSEYLVYKDNVFLSNSNNGARLEMYDRKGNFCTVINEGWIGDYGILNDSVYYLEYYHEYHLDRIGNTIFRYDMKTKEREVYFTFEPNDSFEPRVYFNQKYIIVQSTPNIFVYATTEDPTPRKVILPDRRFYFYIESEDDDLYFAYSPEPDVMPDIEDPVDEAPCYYYKVKQGSTDPVFFTTLQDCALFFKNGYAYYEGENGLVREKLTES